MAVTAREVIMVFRGQNYLSSAIRRVGRDVGMLSRTQQLNTQRAQLQIVGQRLAQSRAVAAAELASVKTGSRKLALDQARASLSQKEIQDHVRLNSIYDQQNANLANRLRLQTRSEMVTSALAGGPRRGFTKNLNADQLRREARAIELAQSSNIAGMDTLEMRRQAAISAIGSQSLASQQLLARETELAQREAQLTQIINTRTRAIDLNTAKLEENRLAMNRLPWERFQAGAQMVEHAGRALQMFGLIGTAVFAGLAKYAADFGTQVTLAATQAIEPGKNSVQQIQRISESLSQGILKILQSGTAVGSSEEFNKSAYDILSGITQLSSKSAVKLKQTIGLLKEFNLVTKANFGLVTFNQVTQAGITLMNTFGTSFKQLPREFDVMQKAVNRGRLTMGQFTDGLNQTAAPAKAAGFTFDQMAGTMSFLSTKFPNYNRAAVGYARLVEMLANPKFITGLRAAGVNITDVTGKHLLPFDKIIERLTKRFPELTKGGLFVQNFFKRFSGQTGFIGARRAFTFAAQDPAGLEKFTQSIPKARGLINASATALSQTGAVKWAQLVTQLKAIAIVIGKDVIPVFVQLAKPVEAAAKWFNSLSPGAQHTIATFGALASVAALLGGSLLAVVGGLANVGIGLGLFLRMRGDMKLLAGEAGAVSARFALGLGLLVLIPLMIRYHTQIMNVVNALGGMKAVLIGLTTAMVVFRGLQLATSIGLLSSASLTAAGDAGILRAALLALGGPEVLLALAAAAAALALLYGFSNAPKRTTVGTIPGSGGEKTVVDTMGGYYEQVRTASRGSQKTFRRKLTPAQVRAMGININTPATPFTDFKNTLNQFSPNFTKDISKTVPKSILGPGAVPTPEVRSVQTWITMVNKARQAMLGSPYDVDKAKAFEKIQNQLNTQFKDQPALLSAINDVLSSYNSDLQDATKNSKTLGITFQDALSGIQTMYDNFKSQEVSIFGALFGGPFSQSPRTQNRLQWGGRLSGADLLKDLKSQVSQFGQFHGQLNRLRRRGASDELINQLTALGPSALPQIKALDKLGPSQLRNYFNTFNRGQKLIHTQTMRDLNAQLAAYRKHGQQVALAIVAGIKSENVGVTNALTALVKKMFPGLPVGATGAGGKPTHKPEHHTTNNYTTHNHIVAPKKEHASVKAQLRHANLVSKNRHAGLRPGPR